MAISASRIFHVNSNCIDLERSLTFYRDLLGLKQNTHPIPSIPQRGDAFGLEQVLWDAWMLQSDLGNDGLSLDLLEWKVPKPAGRPPTEINETGFHHLTFAVPDLQACVERLRDAGVTIVGGPIDMDLGKGRALRGDGESPDGVPLQIIGGSDTRISHVVVIHSATSRPCQWPTATSGASDVVRTVGPYAVGCVMAAKPRSNALG